MIQTSSRKLQSRLRSEPISLPRLLADFAYVDDAYSDLVVEGISLDSRSIEPGFVFFACQGAQTHGLRYADSVIDKGAIAIVYESPVELGDQALLDALTVPVFSVESLDMKLGDIAARFYCDPSEELSVVGVTGTNGKTSCSQFIAQAFSADNMKFGVIGTLGNGIWGAIEPSSFTTPDVISVHAEMRHQLEHGAKGIAMEVSSHALDQWRVNGVQFDIAVLTNLSRDHLDYHGDMAAYAAAKKKLFLMPGLSHAIVNLDDGLGSALASELASKVNVIGYGTQSHPIPGLKHVQIELENYTAKGMRLSLKSDYGNAIFEVNLLGRFNIENVAAVFGVLMANEMPFDQAVSCLSNLKAPRGRMELMGGKNGSPLVVIDYAHTPDALKQSLETLRAHCSGVLWAVFGCGGDRDKGKRPLMARAAEELADNLVLTDDNPRTEDPAAIVADMVAGLVDPERVTIEHDRKRAIAYAVSHAGHEDAVLIAGKGHEDYQIVGVERRFFSDQLAVEEALDAA